MEGQKNSPNDSATPGEGPSGPAMSRALSKPEPLEFTEEIVKKVAEQWSLSRACLQVELPRMIEETLHFWESGGP